MENEKFISFDKFPHGDYWSMWGKPYDTYLFLYLLTHANIQGKQWNDLFIERGQLVTSLESLKVHTGLSIQQARTALNHLQTANKITSKATNKYRIITICNYDNYNGLQEANQQAEQQAEQQTHKQATNKQSNNNYINNRIKEIVDKYLFLFDNKNLSHTHTYDEACVEDVGKLYCEVWNAEAEASQGNKNYNALCATHTMRQGIARLLNKNVKIYNIISIPKLFWGSNKATLAYNEYTKSAFTDNPVKPKDWCLQICNAMDILNKRYE